MKTLYYNCQLLSSDCQNWLTDAWFEVDTKGRINNFGQSKIPTADQKIDLHGQYVMPGLINAHTHIMMDCNDSKTAYLTETEATVNALNNLQDLLKSGVTYIRDCGAVFDVDVKLMKLRQMGKIAGPHIVASGRPMTILGGHGDFPEGDDGKQVWGHIVNSGADMRQAVREEFKHGAQNIKVMATGGVMSATDEVDDTELSLTELKVAVEEAHSKHMTVAAHAQGNNGIQLSLAAGVDSIEHGIYLDDKQADFMKQHNIYLVPTLNASQAIADAPEGVLPPYMQRKNEAVKKIFFANIAKALKKGLKVVVGTDAGTPYNRFDQGTFNELKLLAEIGATTQQVLLGATQYAAELLQIDRDYGSLVTGKYADFLVLNDDPLKNLAALAQVDKEVYQAGIKVR
ncbi:metal-dependent hydrolase family protein [Bombilactobacillus thymidiniphilus]|uniref:Amidohydrolase family protein n=1 Tax=Bombilactobacillus thymidiniphilus TaxID=2923363 RepID=A0ABY4PCU7_9LACO|nr:amidohydrolase family protein [Bombilactobacillus thymidiniphilus]UQS83362.1 amidohydrolase family protein [Bombilactobacillus thymidiniphilus]